MKNEFTVYGTVRHTRTRQPLPGLRVEAWDKDLITDDLLGSAVTDEEGRFSMTFDSSYFQKLFLDRRPDVFFRVFDGDRLVHDTRDSVLWNLSKREHEVVIEIDLQLQDIPEEPDLGRDEVLALHDVAALTPANLQEPHLELYRQLQAKALSALRRTLNEHFGDATDELKQHIQKLDLRPLAGQAQPIKDYLRASLQADDVSEFVRQEGMIRTGDLPAPETLADFLQPEVSIRQNPLLQTELGKASTYRLASFSQLDDATTRQLVDRSIDPDNLTSDKLQALVEEDVLPEETARALGLNGNLYAWTRGQLDLMAAVKERARDPQGNGVRDLRDVARSLPTRTAIAELLEEADIALPDGSDREKVAAALLEPLQRLFPHEVFKAQHRPPEPAELLHDLERTAPLLARNPELLGRQNGSLDLDGVDEQGLDTVLNAYTALKHTANRYPGLDLPAVLNDPDRPPQEKAAEVSRRAGLITQFYALNPTAPFLTLNYMPGSEDLEDLDFGNMSEEDRELVLATGRAQQRLWRVTRGDAEHTNLLQEAGYHAAADVREDSEQAFIANTGLEPETARRYWRESGKIVVADTARMGLLFDETFGGLNYTMASLTSAETSDYLHRLPGYAEFVGNQAYCRCRHCQSIISPAAYFVDLMEFIETNITLENFGSTRPDHLMSLWQRRRDLWELPLTCDHTTTLVPYLTVINEILENYIIGDLRDLEAGAALPDRSEIEHEVYEALYQAESLHSFQQPFMLPLERLTIYLSHFPITRAEIVSKVLEGVADARDILPQAILGVSQREYDLLRLTAAEAVDRINGDAGSAPDPPLTVADYLRRLYGLRDFTGRQDVQQILKAAGIDREALGELIATRFFRRVEHPRIFAELREPGSVQKDVEYITDGSGPEDGLTPGVLDRMHRFIRLWKRLPWAIAELDLVLDHMRRSGLLPRGQDFDLPALASLLSVQQRLRVSVEDLCALIDTIPTAPAAQGRRALMDRLFTLPPFARDTAWPAAGQTFVHPAFHPADSPPDTATLKKQQRLLTGLNIDDETLIALIRHLRTTGGLPPQGEIELDLTTLSRLYRHARLASLLRLSVPDLLQLLELADEIPAARVDGLADVQALLAFYDWWKSTRYSLDDLAFITAATPRDPEAYPRVDVLLDQLRQRAGQDRSLIFVDTVFALINGVTEEQSRTIVALNAMGYYVADATASPSIPPAVLTALGLTNPDPLVAELRMWLTAHQRPVVPAFLASALAGIHGLTAAQSRAIVAANPGIFQRTLQIFAPANANTYRIGSGADLTTLSAGSASGTLSAAGLTSALQSHLAAFQQPGAPAFSDTVFAGVGGLTEEDALTVFTENRSLFEEVIDESLFWLTEAFTPETPILIDPEIPLPADRAHAHIDQFHVGTVVPTLLAGQLGVSVDRVNALIRLAGYDFWRGSQAEAWVRFLHGTGAVSDLVDPVAQLSRLAVLFADRAFTADALTFVREHSGGPEAVIFLDDLSRPLSVMEVQTISRVRPFFTDDEELEPLRQALTGFEHASSPPRFSDADEVVDALAAVLDADRGFIVALNRTIPLPGDDPDTPETENRAVEALRKLKACVQLAQYLGAGAEVLTQIASHDDELLDRAADALYAAFRIKYASEEQWEAQIEPFEDRIRERKRDALSNYILRTLTPDEVAPDRFETARDLYHWFLIDTELEGCARTSRVLAGTSSVQLYVQRCLMNLEQNSRGSLHVTVKPDVVPQWEWRKNYRVWEANRKVFFWPETYIEPELRDNMTPLFEEAISSLLEQEVNEQTVLDAYARYMTGFDELARLKIVGSFHDRSSETDVLHLFGVTSSEPPSYYYRTVDNVYLADQSSSVGVIWGPWRKMAVQIPVRRVSPILFNGRLHVFWVEIATRPKNHIVDGSTRFAGYEHRMSVKFTTLRLDGTWTPPQTLTLREEWATIDDPLSESHEWIDFHAAITAASDQGLDVPDWHLFYGKVLAEITNDLRRDPLLLRNSSYPVEVSKNDITLRARIDLTTPAFRHLIKPKYELFGHGLSVLHLGPKDDYSLRGFQWQRVYPDVHADGSVTLIGQNFEMNAEVDFYTLRARASSGAASGGGERFSPENRRLTTAFGGSVYYGYPADLRLARGYANAVRLYYVTDGVDWPTLFPLTSVLTSTAAPDVHVINGSLTDAVLDVDGDGFYLHRRETDCNEIPYAVKRLGTTLSETIGRRLFTSGIDDLLSAYTQERLQERPLPFAFEGGACNNDAQAAIDKGIPDFTGSLGVYFREIFFHVPFLIANHLNSQAKYAEAQRWYHYIFDPTANGDVVGLAEEERHRRDEDRMWQYVELRKHTLQTLHAQLQDQEAIERYAQDPFNPHAIARVRLGTYKKAVLTKYIDNLLDWGDDLFAQDTMESINEATLLYVMAADLLGERPPKLGDCHGERSEENSTYDALIQHMNRCPQTFAATENIGRENECARNDCEFDDPAMDTYNPVDIMSYDWPTAFSASTDDGGAGEELSTLRPAFEGPNQEEVYRGGDWREIYFRHHFEDYVISFGTSLRKQACVFCIPPNKDLLSYWDRVEDRLYKIRNCMNISGIRRQLSLFAPEIDPRLLVRAKAAGLSLEDVLEATSGNLPPYRFSFLLVKAKEYAGALQAFGGALLSALEKRDAEELARMRLIHQQNILTATTRLRDLEVSAAEANIEGLNGRKQTVTNRRDYYQSLKNEGLSEWEEAQVGLKITGHAMKIPAAIISAAEAGFAVFPSTLGMSFSTPAEVGQTTAKAWANFFNMLSDVSMIGSDLTGAQAGFERREQGWDFSLQQAEDELREIEQQLVVAEIRRDIADRSREIHERTMAQLEETAEFYRGKFSNLGLYTWLSTTLQRLYRQAYQNALTMARLAERAFRFERGDDTTPLLSGNYWSTEYAGLLAGEQLMNDLRQMERLYIETNYRSMEVDQAFSLTQIDPAALLQLKTTGECAFTIPELYFDLFYPGQYRRRIKSARLTIPCITGPYTNVSARLSLTGSQIRKDPPLGGSDGANLLDVPPTRSVAIATSTAQNDAGVFRLDFRDERYMPFEGAGAVNSRWHLSLPRTFRPFDYATINDLILHISYEAEYDEGLREQVEEASGRLETFLSDPTVTLKRGFSLRQEFSGAYHQLLHSPIGTPVALELTDKHFPLFLQGRRLRLSTAYLLVSVDADGLREDDGSIPSSIALPSFSVSHGGTAPQPVDRFTEEVGGLPAAALRLFADFNPSVAAAAISLAVTDPGDLAPDAALAAEPAALDDTKLNDLYLYLEYRID